MGGIPVRGRQLVDLEHTPRHDALRSRPVGAIATLGTRFHDRCAGQVIPLGLLSSDVAAGWRLLLLACALLAALLAILSRVTRHQTVTLQTVMGGIAASHWWPVWTRCGALQARTE